MLDAMSSMRRKAHLAQIGIPAALLLSFGALGACAQGVSASAAPPASAPPAIGLQAAIRLAQQNEPAFAQAVAASRSAGIDQSLSRAAMLPTAAYLNQFLYTEPNGLRNQAGQVGNQEAPVFIANNAVREYASQAVVTETIGLKQIADEKAAEAGAARAAAELEIARRGLVATVVGLYYGVSDADTRLASLNDALQEALAFTTMTKDREAAREAAHADVVKAQLQELQRRREVSDARVAAERARLELGILLFPDPRTAYRTERPAALGQLPPRDEVNRIAAANNPELRVALAALRQSDAQVAGAKAAYLPDLTLNFNYGIDAPEFAVNGPEGARNLGYSMMATVNVPVWDWLSTQKKVKQSEIRRTAAQVALTSAQRSLIADLQETYSEAQASRDQLQLLDSSAATAAESLRLTKLRYAAGEATVLEVVDAQDALLAARISQADGMVRAQAAAANLDLLIGAL